MAIPVAVGELAIAVAKSEAATIALRKLGDYIWPKLTLKSAPDEADDPLARIDEKVAAIPSRAEMAEAFDSLEHRLATLIDVRAQADLAVTRRWVVGLAVSQAITLLAVLIVILR